MDTFMMRSWACAGFTALVVWGCGSDTPAPRADNVGRDSAVDSAVTPPPVLIDTAIPPAVAGEEGWNYQQSAEADLNGDGQVEWVVLTARVEVYRGRPAWDDGQPWQVYIEAPDGRRTYVYAQRLQLGTLTMRLGHGGAGEGQPVTVVLLVQLPDRLGVYEVTYIEPARVSVVQRFERELDAVGDHASPPLP